MYEVWGEDTFARESYLVGTFEVIGEVVDRQEWTLVLR